MPEKSVADAPMSNWAEEVEEGEDLAESGLEALPPPSEKMLNANTKQVTSYSYNEDNKKVRTIRTIKIEKKIVSKSVAKRKMLTKYGLSRDDGAGPSPATTVVAEEVFMQIVQNKEESEKDSEDKTALDVLKERSKGVVKCRLCKEDHWTTNCPYKDTLAPLRESLAGGEKEEGGAADAPAAGSGPGGLTRPGGVAVVGEKYRVRARMEARGEVVGEAMPDRKRTEDTAAIRVSNLSEVTQEQDLSDLCGKFGPIARIFLAKDKSTNLCKGFAFVNFYKKEHAEQAILGLNGRGYDHLILNVEWAKPSGSQ